MKTIKLLAVLFISVLTFNACSDDHDDHDDHDHEHEEEITQLIYTLTNTSNANDVVILTFTDEDGEGGADGTTEVSGGGLTANATYTGVLKLMNLEENEDIGAEIAEDDAEDHEIFYITNVAGLNFVTTDVDANNNPLGFNTDVATGAAGTGALTISIVHEGKKPNNGTVADALSTSGTSDIEVAFTITVE